MSGKQKRRGTVALGIVVGGISIHLARNGVRVAIRRKRMTELLLEEEELMWIYNALCDYDKRHSENLNEKSVKSLRNLILKIENKRARGVTNV